MTVSPILVEMIDLVNAVIIWKDITQVTNFPTQIPECDSDSSTLLDSFLPFNLNICSNIAFCPWENSHNVALSVSIDFPSNLESNVPFYCTVDFYSWADWDCLRDHLRYVPCDDIFQFGASVPIAKFCG